MLLFLGGGGGGSRARFFPKYENIRVSLGNELTRVAPFQPEIYFYERLLSRHENVFVCLSIFGLTGLRTGTKARLCLGNVGEIRTYLFVSVYEA